MSKLDFHFEFHNELSEHREDGLIAKVERRLRELAEGQTDMVGASVVAEELTREETPHVYRARIVAYTRPQNITGIGTGDSLPVALREAVEAVERQVFKKREKLRQPYKPTEEGVNATVYQLSAREIYDSYAKQARPEDLIDEGRTAIAARLMAKAGLDQPAAYYGADQILVYAQELIEGQPQDEAADSEMLVYTGTPGVEAD